MRLTTLPLLVAALATIATPTQAADELELTFHAGRVTVVATDVPLAVILDEWARLGNTTFVDTDQLSRQPISVQIVDVPEREALRVLLRGVGGYVVAPRADASSGTSVYDRVLIMATARQRPPRRPSYTPAPFGSAGGQPISGRSDPQDDTAPPGLIAEPDDPELDELELLEQLRGRTQSTPPPDLFSQPATFFPSNQPDTQGDDTMQTTPRPGMITSSPNQPERPGRRRATPVPPQSDDP